MLHLLLNAGYRKAVVSRLRGAGPALPLPAGGRTARILHQALFAALGRLARLDGRVSDAAIANSTRLMGLLELDAAQRRQAVAHFNQGKTGTALIIPAVQELARHFGRHSEASQVFLLTLAGAAGLDGGIGLQQRVLLRDIADLLGFDKLEYERICLGSIPHGEYFAVPASLSHAYSVLELDPGAADGEIRRAYLRLVARHHPDKLATRTPSAEARQRAQEQFVRIRDAYEILRGVRRLRA